MEQVVVKYPQTKEILVNDKSLLSLAVSLRICFTTKADLSAHFAKYLFSRMIRTQVSWEVGFLV